MKHSDIRQKLSEYLDGAVSPAEKKMIERHLEECEACRSALEELKITTSFIKRLEEVDPPEWLAGKVMARVREEAEVKTGYWRRFALFFKTGLTIEAVALVLITITGYLLYRAVQPEMSLMDNVSREEPARPVAAPPPPVASEKQVRTKKEMNEAPTRVAPVKSPLRKRDLESKRMDQPAPAHEMEAAAPSDSGQTLPEVRPKEAMRESEGSRAISSKSAEAFKPTIGRNESNYYEDKRQSALEAGSTGESSRPDITIIPGSLDTDSIVDKVERYIADMGGRILGTNKGSKRVVLTVSLESDKIEILVEKISVLGKISENRTGFAASPGGLKRTLIIEIKQSH